MPVLTRLRSQFPDAMPIGTYLDRVATALDPLTTGAVKNGKAAQYTIRRSVLQQTPDSVCVISNRGIRTGDCD